MPIYSRLLGLLAISAISIAASAKCVQQKAVANSAESHNSSRLPFNNQSLPTVTAPDIAEKPGSAAAAASRLSPTSQQLASQQTVPEQVEYQQAEPQSGASQSGAAQLSAPQPAAPKPAAPVKDSPKKTFGQCSAEKHLQKSVLVMAFPQRRTTDANVGQLYQAEYQLPQLLSQQLTQKHSTIVPQQLSESLDTTNGSNENQLEKLTQHLGSNYRSQIIVSGEIIDMAMAQPDATYNPGLYTRFVNGLFDFISMRNSFDKRERLFSFQVQLRDGFTGQQFFTKRYDTYGIWNSSKIVGFGTPLFWKSDYGQQVKGLVKMASDEVGEVINCQPFIAQVESRPGQNQIILQGGANNGLHAGDTLALYQLVVQGSETHYAEQDVRLVNRNAAIELREVYPSHSVGVINTTSYLNGQFLALAP